MRDYLLTEEERQIIYLKVVDDLAEDEMLATHQAYYDMAIAKAAQRKLTEWLERYRTPESDRGRNWTKAIFIIPPKDWQALKQELGLEEVKE